MSSDPKTAQLIILILAFALVWIFAPAPIRTEALEEGTVREGMTETQVLRIWGEPSYVNSHGASSRVTVWVYRDPLRTVMFWKETGKSRKVIDSLHPSPEHLGMIARQEIAPGITRENALDIVGLRLTEGHNYVVDLEEDRLSREEVLESWGEPAAREDQSGYFPGEDYIYRFEDGEIYLNFGSGLTWIYAKLSTAWYRKHFPSWTSDQRSAVLQHELRIGMSMRMVLASWGAPNEINKTTSANGVRQQWIYNSNRTSSGKRRYVYLMNSVLTSWQD